MNLTDLKLAISEALSQLGGPRALNLDKFDVSVAADPAFGDFATNAAMVYAKDLKQPPRKLADELSRQLQGRFGAAATVEVAGPGFINIRLSDVELAEAVQQASKFKPTDYKDQVVVAEYSDLNPFKVVHVGHLYSTVVGDAISNLMQEAGGRVHRVNFGGDVGLHVAKNLWAIVRWLGGELPGQLKNIKADERAEWLSARYVEGNQAYETSDAAKAQILEMNQRVYHIHEINDHKSDLAQIYWTCRQWSYDYFEQFYARLGSKFEKYYPESVTSPIGVKKVAELLEQGVLERSDGAVVFRGENYGLHTRVFLNSRGLPTYEAKDLGLLLAKWNDFKFDWSIVITGNDIVEYMKVVLKVAEQFDARLVNRTRHLTHGNVRLAGGVKMSSRLGNVVLAVDVLEATAEAGHQETGKRDQAVVLGAVKYAFLKTRIGPDIVFVPKESVSLEGNSGPYLMYAHARARSILAKAKSKPMPQQLEFQADERLLARGISQYPSVVQQAVGELMPHYLCNYMYELAQTFNRFYEHNRVIGDKRQEIRLNLVKAYADVLQNCLRILAMAAPDRL
jgi:arginyl-tRNA synthetase